MSSQPEINTQSIGCPNCSSKNIRKFGKKKAKLQNSQRYQCKDCKKIFTLKQNKNKTYSISMILNTVSFYNLGYSQTETIKLLSTKFKTKPSQKTASNWLNEYKPICTYNKLRAKAIKLFSPEEIIEEHEFLHNNLPYKFRIHKAKLELLFKDKLYNNEFHNISQFYEPIKKYLEKIPTDKFPHHIFKEYKKDMGCPAAEVEKNNLMKINNKSIINNATLVRDNKAETYAQLKAERCPAAEVDKNSLIEIRNNAKDENIDNQITKPEQRASQIKFGHLRIEAKSKNNLACKLASLALNLANSNKDRHSAIQRFMLINDSTTIAVEIPVYLTNCDAGYYRCSKIKDFWHRAGRNQKGFIFPLNDYKTPITGHIDILQIRNGLIHILDYKPDAHKEQPIDQLTIYALVLSRKLNLPLYHFKCAWFDENNYYEFFPLHVVYKKR